MEGAITPHDPNAAKRLMKYVPTWARTGSIDGPLTAGATQMATEQLSNQNNRG